MIQHGSAAEVCMYTARGGWLILSEETAREGILQGPVTELGFEGPGVCPV